MCPSPPSAGLSHRPSHPCCPPSPLGTQANVEDKVKALRDSVASDDVAGMKKGMETLQQEALKIGQAMYSQGGAAAGGAPPPGAGGAPGPDTGKKGGDDVIDAEFK